MLNATTNGFPVINGFDDWSRLFTVGVLGESLEFVMICPLPSSRRFDLAKDLLESYWGGSGVFLFEVLGVLPILHP